MARWLHYTQNLELFLSGLHRISLNLASFTNQGLCVYQYHGPEQDEQGQRNWGRYSIIIECPEQFVEMLQPNPLNDNEWWDEYIIPVEHFDKCKVLYPPQEDKA